jgi:tRNA pseudouridine55 synthase
VKGKKLYEYARRKGDTAHIQRPLKPIHIYHLHLQNYSYPHVEIEVECSAGTYIRALARDIGDKLHTGGYLSSLQRIRIGPWNIDQAINLQDLTPTALLAKIQPPITLVSHLPCSIVTAANVAQLKQGRAVVSEKNLPPNQAIAILDGTNTLIGIGKYDPATQLLAPQRLFPF